MSSSNIYRPVKIWLLSFVLLASFLIGTFFVPDELAKRIDGITFVVSIVFFAVMPAWFILIGRDVIEAVHYYEDRSWRGKVCRVVFSAPLGCCGVFAIVIGAAVPIWVIYNLVSPQPEFQGYRWRAFGAIAFLGFIPLGYYFLRVAIRGGQGATFKMDQAAYQAYRDAVYSPDFMGIEAMLGNPLPESYKALFRAGGKVRKAVEEGEFLCFHEGKELVVVLESFAPAVLDSLCDREGAPGRDGRFLHLGASWEGEVYFFLVDQVPYPVYCSDDPSTAIATSLDYFVSRLIFESDGGVLERNKLI